jgi:hypothetical protein
MYLGAKCLRSGNISCKHKDIYLTKKSFKLLKTNINVNYSKYVMPYQHRSKNITCVMHPHGTWSISKKIAAHRCNIFTVPIKVSNVYVRHCKQKCKKYVTTLISWPDQLQQGSFQFVTWSWTAPLVKHKAPILKGLSNSHMYKFNIIPYFIREYY